MIPGMVSAFYLFGSGYTYGVSQRGYGQKFTISTCRWFLGDDFRIVSVFSAQLGSIMDTCTASVYEASFFVFWWSLVSPFSAQCFVRQLLREMTSCKCSYSAHCSVRYWIYNAPRAVFSSPVGRSRMLVILADMDQKNSFCGMFKTGFTGCAAPRAVSVSLVRRPVMLGIMARMDQDDSYCGMYKTGYARAVSFSLVGRPRVLSILAGMDQKDRCPRRTGFGFSGR